MAIDYHRASELLADRQHAMVCDESQQLNESAGKLLDALVGNVPWDWRYNATHWALDVGAVCSEIGYSIAWMRAFADYWKECDEQERHLAESHVSYYADNAATRISSCRDKLALLAWSYYCPFNPDKKDEVLNFELIRERFTNPIRFGLKFEGHQEFLIRKFDAKLAETYPDDRLRGVVRESCFLDGVLFDRRAPDQLSWQFEDFDEFAHACWKRLCEATAGSCEILLTREPMLSKDKPSEEF